MSIRKNPQAEALIEALPYIQKYRGQTMVIKYGGAAMENEAMMEKVLRDLVFLDVIGIHPVVVHGGGKAITRGMKAKGVTAQFVDGLRVSDLAAMEVIANTLNNEINPKIVEGLNQLGSRAEKIAGQEILKAKKMTLQKEGKDVDLGFVGEITSVESSHLRQLISKKIIPVISPLAHGEHEEIYNINADIAAAEVAKVVHASKIIYLSDVNGLMRDPQRADSTMPTVTAEQIQNLKKEGVIEGGMLPKVDSAIDALKNGVAQAHFLDGRIPHVILIELFTDAGSGTKITLD